MIPCTVSVANILQELAFERQFCSADYLLQQAPDWLLRPAANLPQADLGLLALKHHQEDKL